MERCEERSRYLAAEAHTFAAGRACQFAPDFTQAARQYR